MHTNTSGQTLLHHAIFMTNQRSGLPIYRSDNPLFAAARVIEPETESHTA